jgi:hypothetical protein
MAQLRLMCGMRNPPASFSLKGKASASPRAGVSVAAGYPLMKSVG